MSWSNKPDAANCAISTAVTVELFHMMRDRERFNRDRYVWNLSHLPREPWDREGKEFKSATQGASPR